MFIEDNNGFVNLPIQDDRYNIINKSKTMIYIIVFHPNDISNNRYVLSNININNKELKLIGDDFNGHIDESNYFDIDNKSISLSGAICVGWFDKVFIDKKNKKPWIANFRTLSHEGKKLYYSMKKLHNQKEVRILTFVTSSNELHSM